MLQVPGAGNLLIAERQFGGEDRGFREILGDMLLSVEFGRNSAGLSDYQFYDFPRENPIALWVIL